MNHRLILLQIYLPEPMKRQQLCELHRRTAEALGRAPVPDEMVETGSYRRMLERYAEFTRDQAGLAMARNADREVLSEHLRREAEEMGRNLRQRLHLRTQEEFRIALKLIYRALGIDLRASTRGGIQVRRCFFSKYYSASVCRLISALDDGLVQGLSGGCRLRFTHRLTEGASCCRALVEPPVDM